MNVIDIAAAVRPAAPAARAAFSGRGTGRSPQGRASAPVSGIGRRIPCAAPSVNFRPKKSGNPHDDRYSSGNLQFGAVSGGSAGFHSGAGGSRLAAPDPGRRLLGRDHSDSGGVPPAEPDRIFLLPGGRASAKENFAALMAAADAELIMFCDHDDRWLPVKVGHSRAAFEKRAAKLPGRNSAAPVHRSAGRR